MIGRMKPSFLLSLTGALLITMAVGSLAANAQTPKATKTAIQQPLYSDYKGIRIGMPAEEVRAKLGKAALAADDQDYYIISQTETVQVAYDAAHKAKAISIDFIEGIGAPDYKAVVGPDVQVEQDGSMHKMVFYESLGFWVSYSRRPGAVSTVTVTIQRIINQ